MDSGAYKNKVIIQKLVLSQDEVGNEKKKWINHKKAYAYVNNLSGSEYWEAAATHQENTVQFIFRYNRLFEKMNTTEYRLLFRKKIYDITFIDNVQFQNRTIKIKAVEKDGKEYRRK